MTGLSIGQFDFDDGGTYCGGSEGGKAHGFGVCTGPGGQGEYSGAWQFGFEVSGVYTWPNGNDYAGQWMQGKRHGLGMERRGHWIYRGEWTQGFMGRYGVRQSTVSEAKYEGTWTNGLHDGYGLETYSDGGTYQGQWMKGMRHGYGVRKSAIQNKAALCRSTKVRRSSLTSIRSEAESPEQQTTQEQPHHLGIGHSASSHTTGRSSPTPTRIGFFLKGKTQEKGNERRGSFLSRHNPGIGNSLKPHKHTSDNVAAPDKLDIDEDTLVETYTGEWKNDKRSGFGVCERSDGLRYEGEWLENCKNGYGITLFPDGVKEEGKYKNNVLLEPSKKMLLLRSTKIRERIDAAVSSALKSAQIAQQKSDIANSRMESSRLKAESAAAAVEKARYDSDKAKQQSKEVLLSEPNMLSPSGATKITKRLSIPRHNMFDSQTDLARKQHQQQGMNSFANPQSPELQVQQFDQRLANQLPPRPIRSNSMSLRNPNRSGELSAVAETSLENIVDQRQQSWNAGVSQRQMSRMINRTTDEPDYSQMNHVDAGRSSSLRRPPRSLERQGSDVQYSNQARQFQVPEQSNPAGGGQNQLLQSRDLSEEDHAAEIENIFSYLAEEEELDMMEQDAAAAAAGNSFEEHQHSSLFSKPSLRYRRDVRCPNLLIGNQGSDVLEKQGPLKRRLTLPSIVKYGTVGPVTGRGTGVFVPATGKEQDHVPEVLLTETIVIDNGVRKRLEEEKEYRPPPLPPDIDPVEEVLEPPKDLPKRYRLESLRMTKKSDLGSLPDVSMFKRLENRAIPRQEAELLCQRKREEIQHIRDVEEQLRKRAVVLKIGEFKEWCRRHELALFLIAVNLLLLAMFSKLLSS